MGDLTISIFGNQILLEIIKEVKLFSEYKIESYESLNFNLSKKKNQDQLAIFFISGKNKEDYEKIIEFNCPSIVISNLTVPRNLFSNEFVEKMNMPFNILDLKKKIVFLFAKYNFKKSSLIILKDYVINKYERKIIKNGLELQLTEKEINFLILFSQNDKPLSRSFVLKNVWHYSTKSDTHTIETHIHRLRKKILDKFKDTNFIKNNKKGYYV